MFCADDIPSPFSFSRVRGCVLKVTPTLGGRGEPSSGCPARRNFDVEGHSVQKRRSVLRSSLGFAQGIQKKGKWCEKMSLPLNVQISGERCVVYPGVHSVGKGVERIFATASVRPFSRKWFKKYVPIYGTLQLDVFALLRSFIFTVFSVDATVGTDPKAMSPPLQSKR